jgi:cysteinyl-tRNA synthetase
MKTKFIIYNTISRKKEIFEPLHPPRVGLYVCGPTVYGDPHLGHARPAVIFDLLFRYLNHLGYKVRYVRNITDVGHLEHDADNGEDKVAKKARLEQLEPMEVVQFYINSYHDKMKELNVLPPTIEPLASGHIIEQQQMVSKLIENGFAYESNGSVYFDIDKYSEKYNYGKLSGRNIEDLLSASRDLEKQSDKKNPLDFALWKKAEPEHIMHWPSPWSEGFPGWHLECSVMSRKYLGEQFDIHGGGMDLLFPHHECEIAQTVGYQGKESVRYWIHNNMITINGQKMGKSLGNSITLEEFFTGNHKLLDKAYSPMTIRFFILQAHYRSPLDFSNEALQATEKGLYRLKEGIKNLNKVTPSEKSTIDPGKIENNFYEAMNDDMNSPVAISYLFDGIREINSVVAGHDSLTASDIEKLKKIYRTFVYDILGLYEESQTSGNQELLKGLIDLLLKLRMEARINKDFKTSDRIRDELETLGVEIRDTKEGFEWKL